jgi:hypothetical protein
MSESTAQLFQTQRIAPLTTSPTAAAHAIKPVVQALALELEAPVALGPTSLSTQETTAFDVAALSHDLPAARNTISETPPASPPQQQAVTKRAAPPRPSRVTAFLTQVGVLTKQRPVLIVGGGLVGAFVLALALLGATRLGDPSKAAAAPLAPTSAKPLTGPVPSATPVVEKSPPVVAVVTPPPAEAKAKARAQKGSDDPVLRMAVGHLAAGRVSEAAEAYRVLSARSEGGGIYAKAAALLARRAGECVAATAQPANCPEILK